MFPWTGGQCEFFLRLLILAVQEPTAPPAADDQARFQAGAPCLGLCCHHFFHTVSGTDAPDLHAPALTLSGRDAGAGLPLMGGGLGGSHILVALALPRQPWGPASPSVR